MAPPRKICSKRHGRIILCSFYVLTNLKRAVAEQDTLFARQAILIEDMASGTQLIQELVQEAGMAHVRG
jgi:phage terminase large subunit-like protein